MRITLKILLIVCTLMSIGLPQKGNSLPLGSELIEQNGRTWLSPIWSQNITYSDMANRLNNNSSAYYGFRIATTYEVLDLFNSLPLVYPSLPSPFSIGVGIDDSRVFGPAFGMMDPFFNQFGWYESGVSPDYSRVLGGYNWDPIEERIMITGVSESDIYGGEFSRDHYELYFYTFDLSIIQERPYYGTWLIKPSPTPEPATVVLFGIGLTYLVWAGRKRRKNY
jgi:hypothetical protein